MVEEELPVTEFSRLSPLGWWEFGDGAEVGGDVQAVSVPVLGWAIA